MGSVDLPMFFRLQWDAWHSSWLWSAAWIDDDRPRLDGGQSRFDVWPRWRKSPEVGEDDLELLWAAGGDGGDDGWLFCPQAAANVQESRQDAAWPHMCTTDSVLSLASRACLGPDNYEAESPVLQHGSSLKGRRPQVAGHDASCAADFCLPLASRSPKNNGEETPVLQDVSPPKSRRPLVTGQIASCAADCCLPLASRICRDPKNNGEETQVLQDVSPPESRRLQVGLLQGAIQVPGSSGYCLPRILPSHPSLNGSFQLPAFASCLQKGRAIFGLDGAWVRFESQACLRLTLQVPLLGPTLREAFCPVCNSGFPTTASESERPRTLVLSLWGTLLWVICPLAPVWI